MNAGFVAGLVLSLSFGQQANRGDTLPAFEAEVTGVRTFAHSGPGFVEFYPTQLLARGDKVTVYGVKNGWAAIGPTKASFSWIPLEAVLEEDDGTGRVVADNVKLRVGSAFSDAHHVFQVTLNKGDKVIILDRKPIRDGNKVSEWFKVRAHMDELRYVATENLNLPTQAIDTRPAPANATGTLPQADGRPNLATNGPAIPAAKSNGDMAIVSASANQAFEPPTRPANGRMIPAAAPVNRLTGLRNSPAESSPNNAGGPSMAISVDPKQPFDKQLSSLKSQLEIMAAREPSKWNLQSAERTIEDMRPAARSESEKAALSDVRGYVRKLGDTQERYSKTIGRFDAALQRDQELAGQQIARQTEIGKLNRRFAAEGTLRRPAIRVGDQPTLAVTNERDQVTHYAISPNGLNLEKYIGKKVGLLGKTTQRPNLMVPVIEVEQVSPLN